MTFQSYDEFEPSIFINNGKGGLEEETANIFEGSIPTLSHITDVVLADFNGDGRSDIFIADHGYDAEPFPGYQNTLILSAPNGKLIDATANLPIQDDFTHSACAADIDNDGDIDLYSGNVEAPPVFDPEILINNSAEFSISTSSLPDSVGLDQNNYTYCEFSDVDNDGDPDLVLGGSQRSNSIVLLNDGVGVFAPLQNSIPQHMDYSETTIHDIEPIELNGDGFIDLILVQETVDQYSVIQVLVNNQDGTFRDETETRIDTIDRLAYIPWLWMRDIDRDGDLDLLAKHLNYMDPDPILYINDGNGYFKWESVDFKLPYLYYTFLDLHGDGVDEIVFWADDLFVIQEK